MAGGCCLQPVSVHWLLAVAALLRSWKPVADCCCAHPHPPTHPPTHGPRRETGLRRQVRPDVHGSRGGRGELQPFHGAPRRARAAARAARPATPACPPPSPSLPSASSPAPRPPRPPGTPQHGAVRRERAAPGAVGVPHVERAGRHRRRRGLHGPLGAPRVFVCLLFGREGLHWVGGRMGSSRGAMDEHARVPMSTPPAAPRRADLRTSPGPPPPPQGDPYELYKLEPPAPALD